MKGACEELLTDLLDVYAGDLGMSLFVTGEDGCPLLPPLFRDRLTEALLDQGRRMEAVLPPVIPAVLRAGRAVLADIAVPGLQAVCCPFPGKSERLLLWAGVFLLRGTRHLVEPYAAQDDSLKGFGLDVFAGGAVELSEEELRGKLERVSRLARIVGPILSGERPDAPSAWLDAAEQAAADPSGPVAESILHSLAKALPGFDYCGLALRTSSGRFTIQYSEGEQAELLRGEQFAEGEGFLGHAALTGEFGSWAQAGRDPRSYFFTQRGVRVERLYCYPLRRQTDVYGVFYVGLQSDRSGSEAPDPDRVRLIGLMIGALWRGRELQQGMDTMQAQLSSLLEVARCMNGTLELRRLLFLLVDVGLTLIPDASSSIVVLNGSGPGSKAQLVSRGFAPEQAEQYGKALMIKCRQEEQALVPGQWGSGETPWGMPMLECPIIAQGRRTGILAVSAGRQERRQLDGELLSSLAVLSGMALLQTDGRRLASDWTALLHDSLKHWNADAYARSQARKELASGYAAHMRLPASLGSLVADACLLADYPPELLSRHRVLAETAAVVEESRAILSGTGGKGGIASYSLAGRMTAMICRYVAAQGGLAGREAGPDWKRDRQELSCPDPELEQAFDAYLLYRHTLEHEISLDPDRGASTGAEPEAPGQEAIVATGIERATAQFQLSAREKEVLFEILQGKNNRDIAHSLFISEHTVKNHITSIFNKIKVPDRANTIALVYNLGTGHRGR